MHTSLPEFQLPDRTRVGCVRLRVADLARSVSFYEGTLGMRLLDRGEHSASLGAHEDDTVLLELREHLGAARAARRGRIGLYHFAVLLPDRAALGRFLRHLSERDVPAGAADHLVSEALYLQDPDGLGIEVYADRPKESWRRVDGELMMATDALDTEAVVGAAGDEPWSGMPAGTSIGHVHLHVRDIREAEEFFSGVLGFGVTTSSYPGALFFGAGGYHHHVAANTWAGTGARPTREDEAGLLEWAIEVPDARTVNAIADRLAAAGAVFTRDGEEVIAVDPSGTPLRLRRFAE